MLSSSSEGSLVMLVFTAPPPELSLAVEITDFAESPFPPSVAAKLSDIEVKVDASEHEESLSAATESESVGEVEHNDFARLGSR